MTLTSRLRNAARALRGMNALDNRWYTPIGGGNIYGVDVTPENAERFATVYACVRIVRETISTLPVHVYQRSATGSKRRSVAINHPVYKIFRRGPNPAQTLVEFFDGLIENRELRGNGYAEIVRDTRGDPAALWPIHPDRVSHKLTGNKVVYEVRKDNGVIEILPQSLILDIGGLNGSSPIRKCGASVALGLAAHKYGGDVFTSGGLKRVALTSDTPLSAEQANQISVAWNQAYGGQSGTTFGTPGNQHKVAVLDRLKPEVIGISPDDAQLLDVLNATVYDICRMFRVQPHKIMNLEKATFSNIEEQNIEFVTDTILPRCVRIEAALNRALLADDPDHFIKFNVDGLLRGDYESRMAGYATAIQNGILSPNEARDLEDWNPYDGGDIYLLPLNMQPAAGATDMVKAEDDPLEDGPEGALGRGAGRTEARSDQPKMSPRESVRGQWLPVVEDAFRRLRAREAGEVLAAAKKHFGDRDKGSFREWLDDYGKKHPRVTKMLLGPVVGGMEQAFAEAAAAEMGSGLDKEMKDWLLGFLGPWSDRRSGRVLRELEGIMLKNGPEAVLEAIEARMKTWEDGAAIEARDKVTQSDGAIAREIYRRNGVQKLRWEGGTCDFCSQLNGQIIGIDGSFVQAGEALMAEGQSPIWAGADIVHPPLHRGCGCFIVAEAG